MISKVIIKETATYKKWFTKLKDNELKVIIQKRLGYVRLGNFGDFKSVGDGVCELRFKIYGGLRIYYTFKNNILILLLTGGNKETQKQDIEKAKQILRSI